MGTVGASGCWVGWNPYLRAPLGHGVFMRLNRSLEQRLSWAKQNVLRVQRSRNPPARQAFLERAL